jgi:hypothetical protein
LVTAFEAAFDAVRSDGAVLGVRGVGGVVTP